MWTAIDPNQISLEDANEILADPVNKTHFPTQFNALLTNISSRLQEVADLSRLDNPLAWIQPSYEQTLKLNAWMYGIDYIVDFDANRIGKTAAGVVNALMWLFPTSPDYVMHQPYTDHLNRTYHTLPRPPIHLVSYIHKQIIEHNLTPDPKLPLDHPTNAPSVALANLILANPPPPPSNFRRGAPRVIWVGAPSNDYHAEIIMPEFKKWIPKSQIIKISEYELTITLENKITILFKSYDAKDTKWSGAAVDGIMLTEGVPIDIFNEVRQRYKYPAFGSWDYTPYEQRNTASKSALAYKVFKGTEPLPLHPYVFHGFGMESAPSHILPDDKKKDLLRMWEGKPQGEARIKGLFYSSSPIILKNYDPVIHAIPHTLEELRRLYAPRPLLLYRGLDPGWGHICACAYMALAPDNTRYIYKVYTSTQRSIDERCQDIIEFGGNRRVRHPKTPTMYQEQASSIENTFKITWVDFHTFKTDELTKRPFALNYTNAGLVVRPSITYGPNERATMLNNLLSPQLHLPHPTTKKPPGSKLYFLINEPGVASAVAKITELFWMTYEKGDKRGMPKDAVQDYDDDELDAITYVTCPVMNYASFFSSIDTRRDSTGQILPERVSYSSVDFV